MSIVANDSLSLILLLLTICCSAVVACVTSVCLLKNRIGGIRTGQLTCGLFAISLILLCVNLFGQFDLWFIGMVKSLAQLSCIGTLAVTIWTIGRISYNWRNHKTSRQKLGIWSMCAASMLICVLCTKRMHASANSELSLLTWPALPGKTKLVHSHVGLTDKGRQIDLYSFELEGELPADDQALLATSNSFPVALIRRKQVDLSANCHGWVFAKGDFLINSLGVSIILEDNDYTRVDRPETGDIAIYRNMSGDVIHTALVCSVLEDNTVLLESKWGLHQRFIHLPEDQPYSTLIEYFRTSRNGHHIKIVEQSPEQTIQLETNMGG
ncbi:MAG: hypothetical protein MUC43_00445 [Pirellula sp.]|nr:hypothetical protein [Pirellula sp.]